MPNSDATITCDALIRRSFRRIGVDSPSVSDIANARQLLNDRIKSIDKNGRWLWTISNTPSTLTLISGTASYAVATPQTVNTIDPYILELDTVELVLSSTNVIPLDIISKTESLTTYLRQSGSGQPVQVFLENKPVMSDQKLWFYPTPDAAYSIQYYYRRRLYDFDTASDNPDFPQEHNQDLAICLSYDLAPEYSYPEDRLLILKGLAEESLKKMRASNQEQKVSRPPQRTEDF